MTALELTAPLRWVTARGGWPHHPAPVCYPDAAHRCLRLCLSAGCCAAEGVWPAKEPQGAGTCALLYVPLCAPP